MAAYALRFTRPKAVTADAGLALTLDGFRAGEVAPCAKSAGVVIIAASIFGHDEFPGILSGLSDAHAAAWKAFHETLPEAVRRSVMTLTSDFLRACDALPGAYPAIFAEVMEATSWDERMSGGADALSPTLTKARAALRAADKAKRTAKASPEAAKGAESAQAPSGARLTLTADYRAMTSQERLAEVIKLADAASDNGERDAMVAAIIAAMSSPAEAPAA